MRHILLLALILGVLTAHSAFAGEVREIEMADGSVLTGEVVSLTNGVYTIQSSSLGTIKVAESAVRSVRPVGSGAGSGSKNNTDAVQALQKKMTNDPDIMAKIMSLQNDPDFQKILADPDIMKAVQAGDIASLTANPAFMKLLNNATVRDIQKKVD